jgi:predicted amidohydrolase
MARLRVTVCQLGEGEAALEEDWRRLVEHVRTEGSEVVLLPEMPFHSWLARDREVDAEAWQDSVVSHDAWMERLSELAPAAVIGSRPVTREDRRLNEGFVWDAALGYRGVHDKVYLPDEAMFWEASWYERGDGTFDLAEVAGARVGFLICTEVWFSEHARAYARGGIHLLAVPRATPGTTAEKWIAGGRTAAVAAGAYCLSSNRGGVDDQGTRWAGAGWIIEPEEGEVLAVTSEEEPFATREIDLVRSEAAKQTYPRYVHELS